jgi:hypothetical protein
MEVKKGFEMIEWEYPKYDPPFPLGEAYKFGMSLSKWIDKEMNGRIAGAPEDAGILAQAVLNVGNHDHLELGALFGGTAILAALVKREFGLHGSITCVDDFSYMRGELPIGPDLVMSNAAKFGVDHRIKVRMGKTHPLPEDVRKEYGSVLIDATHFYRQCMADWNGVKDIGKIFVFHDYDFEHYGVVTAVSEIALELDDVWLVHMSNHTAVLRKVEVDRAKEIQEPA